MTIQMNINRTPVLRAATAQVLRLGLILMLTLGASLWLGAGESAAVALNPGDIIVADYDAFGGPGGVIRVDPVTGAQTTISSGGSFVQPFGIAIDAAGNLLVTDHLAFGGSGGIIRVDPTTGAQTTISSGGSFVQPRGIAIDAAGNLLVADYAAFGGGGGIIRVDPTTGAQTTIASGGSFVFGLYGIAIDAAGSLLVADLNAFGGSGGIIRVDPTTGAQTTIASGGSFVEPYGIAIDAAGSLLVVDARAFGGLGGIIRVDPTTGAQTTIASGGSFGTPVGIAIFQGAAPVPFAAFYAKVEITLGPLANDDAFEVKSIFTLGASSDGLDILVEIVSLQLTGGTGGFSTTIPAGNFEFHPAKPGEKGKPGKPAFFTFEGVINGVDLEVKITDLGGGSFKFKAEGTGADLTGMANPVTMSLTIGDDGGSTVVGGRRG